VRCARFFLRDSHCLRAAKHRSRCQVHYLKKARRSGKVLQSARQNCRSREGRSMDRRLKGHIATGDQGSTPPQAAIMACVRGGREARGNTPRWNAARRGDAGGCASRRLFVLSVRASGSARRRHYRSCLLYPGLELAIGRAQRDPAMIALNRNTWRFIL
jgi:hypothetical protein